MNSWLMHTKLWDTWSLRQREFIRDLGWFSAFVNGSTRPGWQLYGNRELSPQDYADIVWSSGAETKLYRHDGSAWQHIAGPVLFVYRVNTLDYIAGWAGPTDLLDVLEIEYEDPWQWPNITVVQVVPSIAVWHEETTVDPPKNQYPVYFFSNGETNADINFARLKTFVPHAVRIDGVSPRHAAFMKAAHSTTASHFFVVTAKNWITNPHVFAHQSIHPTAHQVFLAKNMSNDWIGGHMGVVLYNRETVLNTPENFGLDFTQWSETVTIPILVSEAVFATSPKEAYRTAFRECVKLTVAGTPEALENRDRWQRYATGPHAEWVLTGAADGTSFAKEHPDRVRESESWDFVEAMFKKASGQ